MKFLSVWKSAFEYLQEHSLNVQMSCALSFQGQPGWNLSSFVSVCVIVYTQLKRRIAENFPKEMNGMRQIAKLLSGN